MQGTDELSLRARIQMGSEGNRTVQNHELKGNIKIAKIEILAMAADALWTNKLRTGLTMLGVIIGITSVIGITSIGQGASKSTADQFRSLGTDVLQVLAGASKSGNINQGLGSSSTLTWDDAKAIAAQVPAAQVVSAYLQQKEQVVYGNQNTQTTVYGTDLNHPAARNLNPQSGRYFNADELETARQVAIIGPTVQRTLFGEGVDPLGSKIRIKGEVYEVIGVMETKGSQGPVDRDDAIYLPLTIMSARLVGNNALTGISVSGIYVKAADQVQLEAAQFQVTNLLRMLHRIGPEDSDDFSVTNQADIIQTFTTVLNLLTVMVIAIAGISLVVGGIGIANIMLVSVVERTREIGIRKALGATQSAILSQFLVEAILISTMGGGIGIGSGVGIAAIAAVLFKFPLIISMESIAAGFGLSVTVGLVAGVVPARSAAKLDPIVALRSD
jgi:putative ABC transport system permease protein